VKNVGAIDARRPWRRPDEVLFLDSQAWQAASVEDISLAQAMVDCLAAGGVGFLLSLLQVADDGMRILYHLAVADAGPKPAQVAENRRAELELVVGQESKGVLYQSPLEPMDLLFQHVCSCRQGVGAPLHVKDELPHVCDPGHPCLGCGKIAAQKPCQGPW
jgi:hypothetical protein